MTRLQELEEKLSKIKKAKKEAVIPFNKKIASITQMIYYEQNKKVK